MMDARAPVSASTTVASNNFHPELKESGLEYGLMSALIVSLLLVIFMASTFIRRRKGQNKKDGRVLSENSKCDRSTSFRDSTFSPYSTIDDLVNQIEITPFENAESGAENKVHYLNCHDNSLEIRAQEAETAHNNSAFGNKSVSTGNKMAECSAKTQEFYDGSFAATEISEYGLGYSRKEGQNDVLQLCVTAEVNEHNIERGLHYRDEGNKTGLKSENNSDTYDHLQHYI